MKKHIRIPGSGQNPILAAQARALEARHQQDQAFAEARYMTQLNILMQMAEDACLISTAEVRGLGPANAEALRNEFRRTLNEMSAMLVDDDDQDAYYSRTKIDQRLAQIEGKEKAKSWDDRLAWCFQALGVKK